MEQQTNNTLTIKWARYAAICIGLSFLNYLTCSYPWVLWVIGSWGFALLIGSVEHYYANRR